MLEQSEFKDVTGMHLVSSSASKAGDVKKKVFLLDIRQIYRHVLMKKFTVDVAYKFLFDVNKKQRRSRYEFDVRIHFTYQILSPSSKSSNCFFRFLIFQPPPRWSSNIWVTMRPARK